MKLKIDVFGLILIAIGSIMLFNYLGYTDIRVMDIIFSYWPLILVYIGIKMLFEKNGKTEIIIGGLFSLLGLGLLGDSLNVFRFNLGFFVGLIWPIGMILIGLSLMHKSKPKKHKKFNNLSDDVDSIKVNLSKSNPESGNLNKSYTNEKIRVNLYKGNSNDKSKETEFHYDRKNTENIDAEKLWNLDDGSYTAFMGGVELDISKARFLKEEVYINLTAVMGGIEISVPKDVTIHCKGTAVLGGLEFTGKESGGVFSNLTGDYIPQHSSKGTIYFTCNVLMGEITINTI